MIGILIMVTSIPTGSAWTHGRYGGYTFANTPAEYNPLYHYGTVDWLADGVLHWLTEYNTNYYWLLEYRDEYLFGTELIGTDEINIGQKLQYDQIDIFRTGDEETLMIKWTSAATIVENQYTQRLMTAANQSVFAIQSYQFEAAAVYLGMYVGYFMLATDPNYFDAPNATGYYPFGYDLYRKTSDIENPNKWFGLNGTPDRSEIDPWIACKSVATNILYDTETNGKYSLRWLNATYPLIDTVTEPSDWDNLTTMYYARWNTLFNYVTLTCASSMRYLITAANVTIPNSLINTRNREFAGWNYYVFGIIFGGGTLVFIGTLLLCRYRIKKILGQRFVIRH